MVMKSVLVALLSIVSMTSATVDPFEKKMLPGQPGTNQGDFMQSPQRSYNISNDCNDKLQRQGLVIEKAITALFEFPGAYAVKQGFAAIESNCKANSEGLFCPKGGADIIYKSFSDAFDILDKSKKTKEATAVKAEILKYKDIFSNCAVIANEKKAADYT